MTRPASRARALQMVLLFWGLSLFLGACSKAGFQTSDVYRRGREDAVMLTWETDAEGALIPKTFEHPAEIGEDKMRSILASLTYSEYVFFKWRPKGPVFEAQEIDKIAPGIVRALETANEDQWVSFTVTSFKRDLLFKTKRLTTGWVWVDDGKMNLVLGNFRLELEHDIEPYDGDPRARYLMATFRIDPAPHLMPPPVVEFDNLLKKEHRNWIVADYKSWAMDDKAPDAPPDVTPAEKSAEERLEELRRLRDKGLITEEEYEQKRREIVDAL